MKRWALVVAFITFIACVNAQEERPQNSDTSGIDENMLILENEGVTEIVTTTPRNWPNRIALYSALFPGLGQIKNHRTWKLPVIYGGAVVLIYGVSNYNIQFKFYKAALFAEVDGDPDTENETGFNESQVRRRVEFYQRNRDFMKILLAALYALNIVDAHVDAHLREFDINEDLSLNFKPSIIENPWNIAMVGVTLQLNFKP